MEVLKRSKASFLLYLILNKALVERRLILVSFINDRAY